MDCPCHIDTKILHTSTYSSTTEKYFTTQICGVKRCRVVIEQKHDAFELPAWKRVVSRRPNLMSEERNHKSQYKANLSMMAPD